MPLRLALDGNTARGDAPLVTRVHVLDVKTALLRKERQLELVGSQGEVARGLCRIRRRGGRNAPGFDRCGRLLLGYGRDLGNRLGRRLGLGGFLGASE